MTSDRIKSTALLISICAALLSGCETSSNPAPVTKNPDAPTLTEIAARMVTVGDVVNITLTATDPNNLSLSYATDGSVGSGLNPYTETASLAVFDYLVNTGQFSWDTSAVAEGDYYIGFSVMNSAGLSDQLTTMIRIQSTIQLQQFQSAQDLYNDTCIGSGCHHDEDNNLRIGVWPILCASEPTIKTKTESGSTVMPIFLLDASQEAGLSYYLNNVRPGDC